MNFLRLFDNLLSVLYEDDDIIAIDKPYGFDAHTNDSKTEHGEAIKDGLIEIYEKNRRQKLHIIHRLDKTTTGVMVFGKSLESAKKYKEFFLNRQVKKEYWFITTNTPRKRHFLIDQPIIQKGKELEAKTEMLWVRSEGRFNVWKAYPFTGRNHQIRIHAQSAGVSLLGDEKYDGQSFLFLCLHNQEITFPNGVAIKSRPPRYYDDLSILADQQLSEIVFEIDRRERLFGGNLRKGASIRLVNNLFGAREPGYHLDQMGEHWVLFWLKERWSSEDEIRWRRVAQAFHREIIVHQKENRTVLGSLGVSPKESVISEDEIKYEVRSEAAGSCGFYLNHRLQRSWLKRYSQGKSVLSLFSYTGTLGLSAAAGGARNVTLVESNKSYLAWAKKNFEHNSKPFGNNVVFLCRDSLTFVENAAAKKQKYDVIVCEVPTFFRREKGVFKIEKDFEKIVDPCLGLLAPGGVLMLSVSYDGFYIDDIRRKILDLQKNLDLNSILPSLDFEWPDQKANLKSFLIRRNPHLP